MNRPTRYCAVTLFSLVGLAGGQARGNYIQTNLVADTGGIAPITDPNLINPWGISFSTTSPLWVSNQGSGTATVYNISVTPPTGPALTETIPNAWEWRRREPGERPDGSGEYGGAGDYDGCDGLSGYWQQGRIHLR